MNAQLSLKCVIGLQSLLWLLCCAASSDAAIVRIRESVDVESSLVTLGDVADVLDTDEAHVEQLKQMTLCPAPAAGRETRLDFVVIRSRLQARGVDLSRIEFSGNSVVTVRTPAVVVALPKPVVVPVRHEIREVPKQAGITDSQFRRAERLVSDAIQQTLFSRAPDLGDVSLTVNLSEQDVPAILASQTAGYEILGGNPPWDSPQTMAVRLRDRGTQESAIPVTVSISEFPYVLAARYSVTRGQILQESDLVLQQAKTPGDALRRPEEAIGKEVKTNIRQGEPIRRQDVRAQPLVRNNDIVTVTIRLAGIRVQSQFRARTDGALGDTVTLSTLDGREQVMASVTGYHEAVLNSASGPKNNVVSDRTGVIQFFPEEADTASHQTVRVDPTGDAKTEPNYLSAAQRVARRVQGESEQ